MSAYLEKDDIHFTTENDFAYQCMGSGSPDADEEVIVHIEINNVDEDASYELYVELEIGDTAWIVDENDSRDTKYVKWQKTGPCEVSIAVANSEAGAVSVNARVTLDSGSKPVFNWTAISFKKRFADAVQLVLSSETGVADGTTPIIATATATTGKNNSLVPDVRIEFEIHPLDSSAIFQPQDGITMPDAWKGKHAWGVTNSKGEVSVPFTDEISEGATIMAYYATEDVVDQPFDHSTFQFKWPDGLKVTVVGLTETTIEANGVPAGTLVEWDEGGVKTQGGGALNGIQIFAVAATKDDKPWTHGKVRFRTSSPKVYLSYADAPSELWEHTVVVELNKDTGRTDPLTVHCYSLESNKIFVELMSADTTDEVSPSASTFQYEFTDTWTTSTVTNFSLSLRPDLNPEIPADGESKMAVVLFLDNDASDDASLAIKILDYESDEELGTGDSSGWAYKVLKTPHPVYHHWPNPPVDIPGGYEIDSEICCAASAVKRHCRLGFEIAPTGQNTVSSGVQGKYGYPVGLLRPADAMRYSAFGNYSSAYDFTVYITATDA